MATEWFFSRRGATFGPVSRQHIKSLASSGQLSPDDLLWKTGMSVRPPAAKYKGLFAGPELSPATSTPAHPSAPAAPEPPSNPVPSEIPVPAMPNSLEVTECKVRSSSAEPAAEPEPGSSSANATDMQASIIACNDQPPISSTTVKSTESPPAYGLELARLALQHAYQALGSDLHNRGAFRKDFPDLYRHLDRLVVSSQNARMRAEDLANNPLAAADYARVLAHLSGLEARKTRILEQLGKDAFATHGDKAAAVELIQAVIAARSQCAALENHAAQQTQPKPNHFLTARTIFYGVAAAVLILLLVLVCFANRSASVDTHL